MAFSETPVYVGAVADKDWISENLLNFLSVQRAAVASRPAAGNKGAFFIASDEEERCYWDDGTAWVNLGELVTSAAQTLDGIKTFGSIPILPASDPTTANQATRKSYVDAQLTNSTLVDSVSIGNVTVETDGASVNITQAGGLVILTASVTLSNVGQPCVIRFRDPSGLITCKITGMVSSSGGNDVASILGGSASSVSVGTATAVAYYGHVIAVFKATQTGIHKITMQFTASSGLNSGHTTAAWVF